MIFEPVVVAGLSLPNRIVMAPMTRAFSPRGVPGTVVADYYRRRAEGGAGLILTEGTWIDHPTAANMRDVPAFYGDEALGGWRGVVEAVHAAGSRIFPQLWHVGMARGRKVVEATGVRSASPSGHEEDGFQVSAPMTQKDIDDVVDAYGRAARHAQELGFDGVEVHAAHGYLIDEFFWDRTNRRTDRYGGNLAQRTRFAREIIAEIKHRVGPRFPLSLRVSQWKSQDYTAVLATTAAEWQQFVEPLADAGVDIFHVSTRRYRDPAFEGSDETLSALTKKITGRTVIAVGSVGLTKAKEPGWEKGVWSVEADNSLDEVERRMARGDFDLIAVGRALLANPAWGNLMRQGHFHDVRPYTVEARDRLL